MSTIYTSNDSSFSYLLDKNGQNDAELLPQNGHRRKPYQAYCVTAPSSRAPSPQPSDLESLSWSTDEGKARSTLPSGSSLHLLQRGPAEPSTSVRKRQRPTEKSQMDCRRSISNQEETVVEAMLDKANHITQPRGNHRQAETQTIVCHRTPSQYLVATLDGNQESFRDNSSDSNHGLSARMGRPLPALPSDSTRPISPSILRSKSVDIYIEAFVNGRDPSSSLFDFENVGFEIEPSSFSHASRSESRDPPLSISDNQRTSSPKDGPFAHSKISLRCLPPPVHFVDGSKYYMQESTLNNDPAQIASTADLYARPQHLSSLSHDHRARRRTQPKDMNLRYQFGRRISTRLQSLPSSMFHNRQTLPENAIGYMQIREQPSISEISLSTPSLHPSLDSQLGPRPPPWGSYDTLESQRRNRLDVREQVSLQNLRVAHDGIVPLRQHNDLEMSLGRCAMRTEVDEYRAEVLRLYPDMQFDGSAGRDGTDRCCCVVM